MMYHKRSRLARRLIATTCSAKSWKRLFSSHDTHGVRPLGVLPAQARPLTAGGEEARDLPLLESLAAGALGLGASGVLGARARQLDHRGRLEGGDDRAARQLRRVAAQAVEPREELEVDPLELIEERAALLGGQLVPEVEGVLLLGFVDLRDDDLVALVLDLEHGSPSRSSREFYHSRRRDRPGVRRRNGREVLARSRGGLAAVALSACPSCRRRPPRHRGGARSGSCRVAFTKASLGEILPVLEVRS